MKRLFAVLLAIVLVGASPLAMNVAWADYEMRGVINSISFDDVSAPEDLSLAVEFVDFRNNIGGFLEHVLGSSEERDRFLSGWDEVASMYNCDEYDGKDYDDCRMRADMAAGQFYFEWLIYPVGIVDLSLLSNGDEFNHDIKSADLSIFLSELQSEYNSVYSGAANMDYDITLEPLVVHKTQNSEYESVTASYDSSTNNLSFSVDSLSQFMVGFRIKNNDVSNNGGDNDDDDESFQDRLVSADNLPTDTKLVIRNLKDLSDSEIMTIMFGEDGISKLAAVNEKLDGVEEDSEEWFRTVYGFYDDLGVLAFFESDHDLLDIFLADASTGEKVPYNGNGITIRYKFDADYDEMTEGELEGFYDYSSRKWSPAVAHIKDDGSREYLPATITDGVWEFTTDSFSTFFPVLVADSVEAPSTLDNTYVNIGVAMISMISLFTMGAWIAKKERR